MKIGSILILMVVTLGILATPAMANGPDYGTTYKSGYTYVSDTVGFDYNQPTIAGSWNNWPSYQWAMAYNSTLKTYPNIFWVYNAELYNTTASGSFAALPPVLETKIKYESGGNHAFTVKYKFYKYQDRPDLSTFEGNLYGNFEYVNYPYLQSLGIDTVFSPTVLYDNISCYNYALPACQGATLGLLYGGDISFNITKTAGFALQRLGTNEMAYSASRTYFNSYNANWKTLYQVWNDISDFSKFVVVNRTTEYTQTAKVRFYQGLNISWESTYGTTNLSIFLSNSTGRIVVNASGFQEQTIWDDNTSYAPPPPPGPTTWDLIVIVRDASTSGLYDGATVTKTDLTDPYYNGWGTTYSGRVTFQAITGHEYNFSASAVGYTTGYANYSAITPINPYVSIWIYPIGTPATGYGYLDFMVRDSVGNTLEQAQVHLTDGQTKYTLMGYTRFNVTASTVIGYSVMKENYNTVTGNITSTTGTLTIPIILYNTGEGPTPTPTLDRRTPQQKFIDAGAIFANNAELFASLIVMALMISLIDKVTLGSLSRAFGGRRKGK